MYEITHLPSIIEIGTTGESNFRTFTFDMRPWLVNVPDGVASIVLIRPGESADDAYIAATTFTDGILTWTPAAADLGLVEGYGIMEIWLEETENNSLNKRGKSARVQTFVRQSAAQESPELPEAQETWLEQMTSLKTQTVSAAIDAENAKDDAVAAKEAAEQAASDLAAAVTAAQDAQSAAETAQGKAEDAQSAAETAQGKAEDAQAAAETAQGKAETAQAAAETAQGEAWDAQAEALGAAEDAQDAAELAAGYVQSAQDAAATYPKIQTGTWWVYDATQGAWVDTGVSATGPQGSKGDTGERGLQGPTGSQGPKGDTGEKGDPFTIKKTFPSIAEMEAYTGSDVTEGDFVAIASTVDDPDNAKLYLKSSNGYVFITDMSGVEGLKGDTGPKGDKGDTGPSGFSPKVNVSETASGHEITVIDADGHETFEVIDGDSPIVSVTDITGGHRVTITDKNGTKTFDVMDGTDGDDGVSPTVTVTEITGGHQVAITDADGTNTFNVMDGEKGDPGEIPQETLDQIEQDISDLNSALKEKADIIVSSASGAIASFPDGAESTAKELVVDIEPVQDLHGYDSPWPPAGNVNILNADGYSFTTETGTDKMTIVDKLVYLEAGTTYTFSCRQTGNAGSATRNILGVVTEKGTTSLVWEQTNSPSAHVHTVTYTPSTSGNYRLVYWAHTLAAAVTLDQFQCEKGSAFTAYTPYSNICPITGWSGANVSRTGKNLLDTVHIQQTAMDSTIIRANNVSTSNHLPIKGGQTYVWDTDIDVSGRYINFYDATYTFVADKSMYGLGAKTFIAPTNACYYKAEWYRSTGITPSDVAEDRINLGSTESAYEPYQGQSLSISFPSEAGTVYGGNLTVNEDGSGKLVVDRAYEQMTYSYLNGLNSNYIGYSSGISQVGGNSVWVRNWNYQTAAPRKNGGIKANCNMFPVSMHDSGIYASQYKTYFGIGSMTSVSEFLSAVQNAENNGDGLFVAYELAESIEYPLTNLEVLELLKGQNNVWADTGNTSVTYRADTKLYIDNKITQAIANALNA